MMKYFIFSALFFLFSNELVPQWELRTNGLPEWNVADILDIANDSTILVYIRSSIVRPVPVSISNNLGLSWSNLTTPMTNSGEVNDAVVFDKNNIWFCTWNGKIYHSNTSGLDWEKQFEDTIDFPFLNFIKFFDDKNGVVIGDAIDSNSPAVVLKTNDGGFSWTSINKEYLIGVISRDVFYPIEFPTQHVGFYCDGLKNKLYKTEDGGVTWEIIILPSEVGKLNMIKFYNQNVGLLVNLNFSNASYIFRTLDGGKSWVKLSLATNSKVHDIEFLPTSPKNIWLSNYDKLFFSADTGNTWQEVQIINESLEAKNIEFINDSIGFILCDEGKFYATENNGGIITDICSNKLLVPKNIALYQNYPNPFNPSTKIKYQIPSERFVQLKVYNILGTEIETLVNEVQSAGEYSVNFNAKNLVSGVYIYKLIAGEFVETKKMILVK